VSWIERLEAAAAEKRELDADPWRRVLSRALPSGTTVISTNMLCQLLGILPTSGNARRVARSMRALGFAPIKSKKLLPGGWRDTECRGWVRLVQRPALPAVRSASSRSIQDNLLSGAVEKSGSLEPR
jgi:hypothetical protein